MHRLTFLGLLAAAALPACKRIRRRPNPAATVEEPGDLATSISMGNPNDSTQILYGLYPIEGGAWRWTKRKFGISLRPPDGANRNGTTLKLDFAVPDAVAHNLLPLKITAIVAGAKIETRSVTARGQQSVTFSVPASVLAPDAVTVEFELDRVAAPSSADSRELGIIAAAAGFVSQ